MIRELVIHANSKGVEIALLENKKLVEYHLDAYDKEGFAAGDVYLGRVKKLNPGLNAAFIDIGHDKDAFIHYSDLSPYIRSIRAYASGAYSGTQPHTLDKFAMEPYIDKDGKIEDVLQKGDVLICQIAKEAISTKGPRLTCELSIPGRYIVLTPFQDSIGISKKITDDTERDRLTQILREMKPKHFGLVVRTNAEKISREELQRDIENLVGKWKALSQHIHNQQAPKLLLKEMTKSFSIIRDLLNDSFERIITDSAMLLSDLREFVSATAPDKGSILQMHLSHKPLFEEYDVSRQVKTAFGKIVTLKSGAYIVVEHTEALHVIDVNSGPKIKRDIEQDTHAFNINVEAGHEIARQMRLRNIGGIIVIDFIDMKSQSYKNQLLDAMHEAMRTDKAKHVILPVSKFGLMEITRQRVKEQVTIDVAEPSVNSRHKIDQPLQIVDNIFSELELLRARPEKSFLLYVHPFIYAFLKKGTLSFRMRWYYKINKWVKLVQDSGLRLSEYKMMTADGEKIL